MILTLLLRVSAISITVRHHRFTLAAPEAHPDAHERLEARPTVDQQVLVPLHDAFFEQHDDRRPAYTKGTQMSK